MSASRAAYELVQKKTFTNWANVHLRRKGESMLIEDLFVDLADGTRLCSLFEVLTGQTIKHRKRKKIKKATHKLHSCENINQALHFVEAQNIKLVNMDASFIYEGRANIILGLMWTSILNFQVADIDLDGLTGKRGLLEWAKRACKAQGVKVSNFTTSWNNGRALCALIANFRGDLLTMAQVGPKEDAMANTEKALTIGSEQLDIPIVMDAEDLCVSKPDEKSVVTMVAEWFKAFAGQMKSAAYLRAVVNAVNLTRAHDDLISQYEEKVVENAEWADERTAAAEARSHGGSTDEVKAKLDEFYTYKGSDKVAKSADLQHTENILLALRTSQANGGRPTYEAPSEELEMEALKARFEVLDDSEDKCVAAFFSFSFFPFSWFPFLFFFLFLFFLVPLSRGAPVSVVLRSCTALYRTDRFCGAWWQQRRLTPSLPSASLSSPPTTPDTPSRCSPHSSALPRWTAASTRS